MKKLLIICLLINIVFADSFEMNRLDGIAFNFTKNQKAHIWVKRNEVFVVINKKLKIKLQNFPKLDDGMMEILHADIFIFDDFNFDGYSDIAVLSGGGYAGVNIFRNYYFYNRKEKTYEILLWGISNLKIDKKSKELYSVTKTSGNLFTYRYFKIKNGKPYLYLKEENNLNIGIELITEYNSRGKKIKSYYDPSYTDIKTNKAYFYDKPNGKKLKSYLIKDDRVKILKIEEDWIKVEYKAKRKTFRKWIKLEEVTIN